MAENGRLSKLDGVINSFKTIMAAYRGEVTCQVTSAKVHLSQTSQTTKTLTRSTLTTSRWMLPPWRKLKPPSTDSCRRARRCRWLPSLILPLSVDFLWSLETVTLTWAWPPRCSATLPCWNRPFKQNNLIGLFSELFCTSSGTEKLCSWDKTNKKYTIPKCWTST